MRPTTHVTPRARRLLAAGTLVLAALAVGCASSAHRSAAQTTPAPGAAAAAGASGPIAFMRFAGAGEDDHSAQIFTRSPAGAVRQLTHLVGGAFDPAWSPDGSRIAFERWFARQRNPDQLFTMKADGTDVRPLTSGCERSGCLGDDWPSYSPDGSKIAFVRSAKPLVRSGDVEHATAADLMVVASGGGAPTVLHHFGEDPQPSAPAWSPDGSQLVLALSTVKQPTKHTRVLDALFVLDVASAAMRQITPWALGASDPDYSPDGKLIVFNSQAGHSPLVYVVRPDGNGLRRISRRRPVHSPFPDDPSTALGAQWQPSWSPDGRQIVFATEPRPCASRHVNACPRRDVARNLFVMNADGTHVHRLTKSPRTEAQPVWAPAR